jgi:hypothetical protein
MSVSSDGPGAMSCSTSIRATLRRPNGRWNAPRTFALFRRAKLMLGAIDPATVEAAVRSGRLLGRLRLTDAKGHPLCARVQPPLIEWSAAGS